MKRFSVKTFGALLIAAGLTLAGVAAPASAVTSGTITPNTFVAGSTISSAVTITYSGGAGASNAGVNINMQSLLLPALSCSTTPSTTWADCGVASMDINGSAAPAGTLVGLGSSAATLFLQFSGPTAISSVSISFSPSTLNVSSTPTGSRNVSWSFFGGGASGALSTSYTVTAAPNATVTFDANDGTGSTATQSANSATALTANTFTRSGYTFAGWNTVAGGTGTAYADGASYPFASNITLYAQWTANSSGGSGGGSSSTNNGLASTGFDSMPYLVTGGALTVLGFTLVFLTRPRRVRH